MLLEYHDFTSTKNEVIPLITKCERLDKGLQQLYKLKKKKKKLNNFVPTSLTLARWAMPHNNVFCLNIFIDIRFIYLIKSWKWLASQSLSSLHLKFDPHWVFYFYDFFLSTFHHPGINFLHMNSDMPYESWTPINSSKNICQYIQHFLK